MKSISSSEQMGMSYQASSSEQLCINLTGEQAQKPVMQEQEDRLIDQQGVSADVEETFISQPVSDDDQIQGHVESDQSF